MKLIPLSKRGKKNSGKYFAMVDDADFDWLNQWNWYVNVAKNTYYALRETRAGSSKAVLMHRLILGLNKSRLHGDHIDHNGLNNQRSNIRIATRSQNVANRKSSKNSSSKYLGVTLKKGKYTYWYAQIEKEGKVFSLGTHKFEEDAARAYDAKAKELHGEFANLNFK